MPSTVLNSPSMNYCGIGRIHKDNRMFMIERWPMGFKPAGGKTLDLRYALEKCKEYSIEAGRT